MVKFVGYMMLAVVVLMVFLSGLRVWSLMAMAEVGLQRPGAVTELTMMILCGVVIPIGIATLLLKK
ncbi:hypothetical protein WH367_11845 [Comamonas sp. MYb21]|uniref:hypothetical protein n=1 Tax=unclassified Comamonas TaxID=2638500 RepID=UPI0030A064BE